jgi:tRNA threonylcarbamoyladenosine biosynthesis protein TsaB
MQTMKLLGIQGGGWPAGVALLDVDEEAGAVEVCALAQVEKGDGPHASLSSSLLRAVDAVLDREGAGLDDVGALAVGTGPGSWTSLRVTLSLAKTLAQAREWALVGVPSFDALARAAFRHQLNAAGEVVGATAESTRLLLVVGECRAGEVYAKIFEASEDHLSPAQDEWIATPTGALDALWSQGMAHGISTPPLVVCSQGDRAGEIVREAFAARGEAADFLEIEAAPAALEVALAALERLAEGDADDALSLQPLYLAPSAAERARLEA